VGLIVLAYYYLYEAKQRLANAKQTIEMMGGEDECQPMLLGQRDMLELEVEYYRKYSWFFTIGLLTFTVVSVILYVLYSKGII
jgi:lipopolysaccharide export LptBFGC system permease protein LptF